MKENLIIAILKLLQLVKNRLNFKFMQTGLLNQKQIVNVCIVRELIRNQFDCDCHFLWRRAKITHCWDLLEILKLTRDGSSGVFQGQQIQRIQAILQDALVFRVVERQGRHEFCPEGQVLGVEEVVWRLVLVATGIFLVN